MTQDERTIEERNKLEEGQRDCEEEGQRDRAITIMLSPFDSVSLNNELMLVHPSH